MSYFRWTDHQTDRGTWCRWSRVSAPPRMAEAEDQRCPRECPGSAVEPDPQAEKDALNMEAGA